MASEKEFPMSSESERGLRMNLASGKGRRMNLELASGRHLGPFTGPETAKDKSHTTLGWAKGAAGTRWRQLFRSRPLLLVTSGSP